MFRLVIVPIPNVALLPVTVLIVPTFRSKPLEVMMPLLSIFLDSISRTCKNWDSILRIVATPVVCWYLLNNDVIIPTSDSS